MVRTSQGKTVKKTPAKGKAPAEAKTKTKISKSKRTGSFETYAYKVLKQVHPDTGIKSGAMGEVNAICMNLFHNIANRAKSIMAVGGKNTTLSSRLIQSATRSVLPGELAKHAVSEGTKAVTKYNSTKDKKSAKPVSRSYHAGLQFPVGRIDTMLRKHGFSRVSGTAPVYLAAVIEYFCAEILELAGNAARDFKRVRISTRHIVLAMRNDSELDLYARKNCLILPGGYMPHINKFYVENVKEQAKKRKNARAKAKRAPDGLRKTTLKAKAPAKRVSGGKRKSQ